MHKMAFAHVFGPEKKNGFGPFSYKFFVCIRVGLNLVRNAQTDLVIRIWNILVPIRLKKNEKKTDLEERKTYTKMDQIRFFSFFFNLMGTRMVQIRIAKSV